MEQGTPSKSSSDGFQGLPMSTQTEERLCRTCGKEFEATVATVLGRVFGSTQCPDCAAKSAQDDEEALEQARGSARAELRQEWLMTCGLGTKFQAATFESWEPRRGFSQALDKCQAYAERFPVAEIPFGYPSLWLYSRTHGLGKTHLVSAIAHRVIERWAGDPAGAACPVRYETGPSLLLRVRRSYNRPRDPDEWQESEADIYDSLRGVRLLILDDVGDKEKEAPSEHTRRVYFHVIDQRYADGLPVVFCSNVEGKELESVVGSATFSRLRAMAGGVRQKLGGEDFRLTQTERKTLDEDPA